MPSQQGILMRSIIIHDFSMKWAFSEDSRHPTEKKSFIFGLAMAQRSESRAKLAWAMPSKQAILKQSFIRSSVAAVEGLWLMDDG